jgi:uncharacterized protein YfkK (UPF0435 family)
MIKLIKKNPKSYFDLTFEEVKEKLDDLGINLFDNEEWDCYDIYPQYTMRGLGSTEYTIDRSEESLKEAYKKGLQMAKKAGKFSKITFNQSESSVKRKKSNPDNIYSLWKDLSSRDSTKARKAALALKQHFAGKSKLSDFWSIIREESNLTVSEIKAKIESVIKKTSGARVNPIRKTIRINPQTLFGFFPFETKFSLSEIESLILQADEINELERKKKPLTADKRLEKLERRYGKKLANQVVAWRKYNS